MYGGERSIVINVFFLRNERQSEMLNYADQLIVHNDITIVPHELGKTFVFEP